MAFKLGEDIVPGFAGARTAIKMLSATDLGSNAILEKLRDYGYSFNDSKARADIAANRAALDTASYWKAVNYANNLNVFRLPVSDVKLAGNVQYTVIVYGKDQLTGERGERAVKLNYDATVSKNQAILDAMRLVNMAQLSTDPEVARRYPMAAEYGDIEEIYTSLGAF